MSRRHGTAEWKRAREAAKERDGYKCVKCGSAELLEVDHIVSYSEGGAFSDLSNLQTLCLDCHLDKTAKEGSYEDRGWRQFKRGDRFNNDDRTSPPPTATDDEDVPFA